MVLQETHIDKKNFDILPSWETARKSILPWLESVDTKRDFTPALRIQDTLATMITEKIKMCIAYFYEGIIIPLTGYIIQRWNVSWAAVRLAMDENMHSIMQAARIIPHNSAYGFNYMTVSHPVPAYNASLAFYKPFQNQIHQKMGDTYYMALPEHSTTIVFDQQQLQHYSTELRNDILLTYDCAAAPLTTELLEVSSAGIVTLLT